MIDNACFRINNFSNNEFERLTERLDIICPIDSNKVNFKIHNIRIQYLPNSNELEIKNSWHCYYNAVFGNIGEPVNYNDFRLRDFQVVASYFSEIIFERPPSDFMASTNFEVGLNIKLDGFTPITIMERYMSCVTTYINAFYPVRQKNLKGKPIQIMCDFSDFKIKTYDKSQQSQFSVKNIMRYEIIYTALRKIRNVLGGGEVNLEALSTQDTWNKFFSHLLSLYDATKKIPLIPGGVTPVDIPVIHGYCNKIMAADIKNTMNPNTYDKIRAGFKRVYDHYDGLSTNYHQVVRQKLINKYNSLTNIRQFQSL